ncbi:MAG TPA: 6-phosphofructokinase [Burkholderiales bacterium]|nr:6-phosphofructokinase [Burkholderiales bacterium]
MSKNVIYAQSGGVTAVINASACGVIETARAHPGRIGKIYAGQNGILGILREKLIDTSLESDTDIARLKFTPGGAFGSCRYKLKKAEENPTEYKRIIDVFQAHNIGYFFYNGGGDSQDTTWKIANIAKSMNYPLVAIGIPKTVDNDLPVTDSSPGFGSVAKYVATSIREASYDIASMAETSTRVFVLEVMGRHAGWITASCALAKEYADDAPHLLLLPERPFNEASFLDKVKITVARQGYCVVAVSEGVRAENGNFLSETGMRDAFGHAQLGGVAPFIANLVQTKLSLKVHWAVADYLQRSARHIASLTDVEQAYAVGKAAVKYALEGENTIMPIIHRLSDKPYKWEISKVQLSEIANVEKHLPEDFINKDGYGITEACHNYLLPLIQGESPVPMKNGLPDFVRLKNRLIEPQLPPYAV